MSGVAERIDALDPTLFALIESQTTDWDRRALLALHACVARVRCRFSYLEIGSFRGGSLQAVMRDPRCGNVVSIDPRPASPADKRTGTWTYEDNSTAQMIASLTELPGVNVDKLTTFEVGTDMLQPHDLPVKPDYCFIDGEHTDEAVLRDARFCAAAVQGAGIVAFHDYALLQRAIRRFLREVWDDVSYAVPFVLGGGGGVFAVEFGDGGLMRLPFVDRAVASRWHSLVWKVVNSSHRSPAPFLWAWSSLPVIDHAIANARAIAVSSRLSGVRGHQ